MATGQAAGIAAALAAEGRDATAVDVATLQKRLRDAGAILE